MKIGDKIETRKFLETHRQIDDPAGLINFIFRTIEARCWGFHAPRIENANCFRFRVQGDLHKGHVYVTVNPMDTFDLFFTTTKGTIKQKKTDIYIDSLIEVIDKTVETK